MGIDSFNVVAGIVTIISLFFSSWIYWMGKRKDAVESQRIHAYRERLVSVYSMINAAMEQATLVSTMADREETSKKELKHLSIAQISTLNAIHTLISHGILVSREWKPGIPDRYREVVPKTMSVEKSPPTESMRDDSIEKPKQ